MPTGLPVSKLIDVTLNISPLAAQFANFDTCLIIGDSNVINVKDRIRSYSGIAGVASDFGTSAPEYAAANLFFSQTPQPTLLYIGRWAKTATAGLLVGGVLTTAQQTLSNWTAIADGGFKIAVDGGVVTEVDNLNFSAQTNLNGVAAVIQTGVRALAGVFANVSVTWNGKQFTFASGTTGLTSQVSALTSPTLGGVTDISAQLKCTATTLQETVAGIVAESALQAVQALDQVPTQWYALAFAATAYSTTDVLNPTDTLAIAAFIEADASNPHIFGVTTEESSALSSADNTSIGYQLNQLKYRRTFWQYSSSSLYAAVSIIARGCTVNFAESLSTINFMWKQEPGVVAEQLTVSQAAALDANNYNYFAAFNNNTTIIVNGTTGSGYIDETWDLDWLVNQIQTDVFNLLYTQPKIPQTDPGEHLIKTTIEAALSAGVNNGTLAPGTWNAAGFGQLQTGDFLALGFYVFQPPISSQAQADREARKSVPFQVAAKLAGAVNDVAITVNVNR